MVTCREISSLSTATMSAFPVAIEIGYRQCHLALAGQVRDYGFESAIADAEQNTHASGLTLTRNYGDIRDSVVIEVADGKIDRRRSGWNKQGRLKCSIAPIDPDIDISVISYGGEIRLTVPVEIPRHNGIRVFGIGIDHRCSERSVTVIHQYRLVVRDDSEFVRFARPR